MRWVCSCRVGLFSLALLALACGRVSRRPHGEPPDLPGTAGARASSGGFAQTAGATAVDGGRSSSGAGGAAGSAGSGGELSGVDLDGSPIYTRVQRLTNAQWERAVTDILRLPRAPGLSAAFTPPVLGATEFDNNERILFVDSRSFGDFESGAEAVAALATGSAEALAALHDGDDAAGFVRALGRRAFRRPLALDEEKRYQAVFELGEKLYGPGFANGAALVIRAMLQSPHFLYRTELGPAGQPLDGYEVASKLSFSLLGTTPSDELLDAAEAGELDTEEGVEAAARRMLDDPRAVEVMRDFHEQLLHTRLLASIEKVGVPAYDPAIREELLLASRAFFDRIFREGLGLREILTSPEAFVGPGLAPLYGVKPPAEPLVPMALGPSRIGYFMQIPFLMLWGVNEQSDPIRRGLALHAMTCGSLPTPNPDIPSLPPLQPGQTNRERISQLTASCGDVCHGVYINPLGFSLENFDGLGRERHADNGKPIDTTGSYPFAEGVASFADGAELMHIMAESAQVHTCYSKKVTGYALGRDIVEGDRPLLEALSGVSTARSLKEVVIALVRNPAFRTRQETLP